MSTTNCQCGKPVATSVVKKEGQNHGRSYSHCATRACKYFEWCDGGKNLVANNNGLISNTNIGSSKTSATSSGSFNFFKNSNSKSNEGGDSISKMIPNCKHGTNAMLMRVKKVCNISLFN